MKTVCAKRLVQKKNNIGMSQKNYLNRQGFSALQAPLLSHAVVSGTWFGLLRADMGETNPYWRCKS